MVWKPPEKLEDAVAAEGHGPRPTERIPRSEYTAEFLNGLEVRGEVVPAGEQSRYGAGLPAHVNWVIHPNGDLERIGFDL